MNAGNPTIKRCWHLPMNILLIEDEVNVVGFIKKGLEDQLFHVAVAYDGNTGLEIASRETFDVIILDVILPRMNGWDICRALRTDLRIATPILMLSALNATEQVIKGLNVGADDYLGKPFKMDELVARLHALHRRHKGQLVENPRLSFADIEIDLETREAFRAGEKIQLTAREYKLLEYFMKNPGRVLSRTKIIQQVWGVDFDMGTNVVDVYINYLRNKIDKGYPSKLIHTVIGMGYMLKKDDA